MFNINFSTGKHLENVEMFELGPGEARSGRIQSFERDQPFSNMHGKEPVPNLHT